MPIDIRGTKHTPDSAGHTHIHRGKLFWRIQGPVRENQRAFEKSAGERERDSSFVAVPMLSYVSESIHLYTSTKGNKESRKFKSARLILDCG